MQVSGVKAVLVVADGLVARALDAVPPSGPVLRLLPQRRRGGLHAVGRLYDQPTTVRVAMGWTRSVR